MDGLASSEVFTVRRAAEDIMVHGQGEDEQYVPDEFWSHFDTTRLYFS